MIRTLFAVARQRVVRIGAFWWDFIVGDDWRLAVAVIIALALTALAGAAQIAAWWIVPALALSTLTISVTRARTANRRR